MRKERLIAIADWLERTGGKDENVTFDMGVYLALDSKRGTVACIAGLACQMFFPFNLEDLEPDDFDGMAVCTDRVHTRAEGVLGLTEEQANKLFCWDIRWVDPISAQSAARTIRRLVETGEVRW